MLEGLWFVSDRIILKVQREFIYLVFYRSFSHGLLDLSDTEINRIFFKVHKVGISSVGDKWLLLLVLFFLAEQHWKVCICLQYSLLLVSAAQYCSVSQCVTLTRCQILLWKSCNSTPRVRLLKWGIWSEVWFQRSITLNNRHIHYLVYE